MMLDHVGVNVSDLARSRSFYEQLLAPLGIGVLMELGAAAVGFGESRMPHFFLHQRPPVATGVHVAFSAGDHAAVQAFHAAGLAAGGTDNGAPGPRDYHPNYYGAFVLDPDGNNIEAVCHSAA
jgi:catechol 2,3-dioxygenase-like lactoylglutathione lyase family enzyme